MPSIYTEEDLNRLSNQPDQDTSFQAPKVYTEEELDTVFDTIEGAEKLKEVVKQEDFPDIKMDNDFYKNLYREIKYGSPGAFGPSQTKPILQELAGRKPGVNYDKEAPAFSRAKAALLTDTPKEEEEFYKKQGYTVSHDNLGRLILKDPRTGEEFPADKPEFNLKDLADLAGDAPELAALLASTVATRGSGFLKQLFSDILSVTAASKAQDVTSEQLGYNLESYDEIKDRTVDQALFTGGAHIVGKVASGITSRLKSPLPGGITEASDRILKELEDFNKARLDRGLKPIKLPVVAFNESPFISRTVGFLTKIPGAAGVFKKESDRLQTVIDEEIEYLTKDLQGIDKQTTTEFLKQRLKVLIDNKLHVLRRDFGLKPSRNIGQVKAGESLQDAANTALNSFKTEAQSRAKYVQSLAGDKPVFSTKNVRKTAKELLEKSKYLEIGLSKKQLETIANMPEKVTFLELQNLRTTLGDALRSSQPIGDISQGQASALYKAVTQDIKALPKDYKAYVAAEPRKFVKEFTEFNSWYAKNHNIFNTPGSPVNKIIKSYSPDKLAEIFVRSGQASNIKLIRQTIGENKFKEFQEYSLSLIVNPDKTGQQIQRALQNIGKDTINAIWNDNGTMWNAMNKFAKAAIKLQNNSFSKFLADKSNGERLFTTLVKSGNIQNFFRARNILGPNSKDYKLLQIALADDIIKSSLTTSKAGALPFAEGTVFGHIDGRKMLSIMKNKYGDKNLQKAFKGTPLYENLKSLANLLTAAKSVTGEAAGGLAAGMFVGSLLLGAFHPGALLATGTVAVSAWLAAKILTAPTTAKILTRQPISKAGRSAIRFGAETLEWFIANEADQTAKETSRIEVESLPGLMGVFER